MLLAAGTLSGCGWFDGWFGGSASPLQSAPLRPGVDRQTTATGLPPAPNRGSYDAGVVPEQDRAQPIGSIVAATGGQKAQIEKMEKERSAQEAERDKERMQREAERDRENTETPQGAPPPAAAPSAPAPSDQLPAPAATPAALPAPAAEPAPSNPPAQR